MQYSTNRLNLIPLTLSNLKQSVISRSQTATELGIDPVLDDATYFYWRVANYHTL